MTEPFRRRGRWIGGGREPFLRVWQNIKLASLRRVERRPSDRCRIRLRHRCTPRDAPAAPARSIPCNPDRARATRHQRLQHRKATWRCAHPLSLGSRQRSRRAASADLADLAQIVPAHDRNAYEGIPLLPAHRSEFRETLLSRRALTARVIPTAHNRSVPTNDRFPRNDW